MNGKKILSGITIILLGGIVLFFSQRINREVYESINVQRGTLTQEVLANGRVESPVTVDLYFKNSGKIDILTAEVGQKVRAGEVLAKQNTDVLDAEFRQTQAEIVNQEYKLKLVTKDETKKTDEESYTIKSQKAMVEKARADRDAQEMRREEFLLISPIDGSLVAVNSEVGEIAKPETVVASVISDDNLQISVDVSETTIVNVKVGQTVRISLDAFDDEAPLIGKVAAIDPAETIQGEAVYYTVIVSLDKEDIRIRPGMTANVWIETAVSEDALFVPISAVQKKDNKKIVQVLDGKKVIDKEVVTGIKNNMGMIEIVSGLLQNDQVVLGTKK